ncbi:MULTISPECIES: glutamate--cysteine ligase [Nocardia]|uniref:Putative glutamate--cysteine ligase 2-2 n=2 Tax=Nocardia farcinica TaxID=37329 RepID=GCS22_NOCFA|nr:MULTISPECIES: glutamate--cysteine ligase [Nocardia]Q5YNU2.1 RecName: Full=Putative glutamate--cysteine ligase 2-2; AltName: Full=Gamma-glutamylcysteine synthetase 2-2; Short=GCS 2-2; Short=Gamma-GCS 2-2 [Nocardia farcinica IFM 10152]MBF6072671.1 glutamate--cysteine ligase [Nocardia farcinica]MBF6141280.1 glutamate--cysteine ligase [Nocardia farcinica]MBF6232143.1 glutamate--cysteine ligase [Nocardia farcinica]MBF6247694.1 glutamate--cysteine ligase [Nocardia elegans]MBF6254895.1 glutamate-
MAGVVESVPFEGSPRPTIGIEWEVALVDKVTRDLSNTAAAVFDAVGDLRAWDGTPQVTKELLRNTVEIVTGVHETVGAAVEDLRGTMDKVRRAADPLGVDVFCAGTHPFAQWSTQQLTRSPHYDELIERTQWWGRQMMIWGVHVHVGVSHREKVFPILNSLLTTFPHLLALSASSPMWAGSDTGYASNRTLMFQQLPTAGLPFQFENWRQFEHFVHDELKTGVFEQLGGLHWDIRPAPKWGTIEVRICDGIPTHAELAAIAAFIHCLIVDLDQRIEDGEQPITLPPWHVQENKWRAARYGLDAIVITDADSNERLVTDDLMDLLNRLEPTAKRLGCADELAYVATIPERGASYQRQRKVAAASQGDLVAVVDALVHELDR